MTHANTVWWYLDKVYNVSGALIMDICTIFMKFRIISFRTQIAQLRERGSIVLAEMCHVS